MSYLSGGYLSGDNTLSQSDARDIGFAQATSQRQIENYKKYYKIIANLSPQALQNLAVDVSNTLEQLPASKRNLIKEMALRTTSYTDPRAVVGLGLGPLTAVTGAATGAATAASAASAAANTAKMIASIVGIVATLATVGLTVAQGVQQRKDNKAAAAAQQQSEALQQEILRTQLDSIKAEAEAKKMASQPQPQIGPNGELILPSDQPKTNTTAIAAGLALTGAAAYVLMK